MNCANCGQPVGDSDVFCGTCGADLNAQRAAAQQPTQAVPAPPTQVMPQQQPTQVMPPAGGYAPPPPGAAMPPQQPYAGPGQPGAAQQSQTPRRDNKTIAIVAGVIGGGLLLCSCLGAGAWAYFAGPLRPVTSTGEPSAPVETTEPSEAATDAANAVESYPTPEEAVKAEVPKSWVVRKVNEGPQQVEFWAGPPASEFTTVYLVDAQSDGGWLVGETYPLEAGGDVQPQDEAAAVVEQHLKFVKADKGLEAQKLTISPFKEDSASAQVSAGGFTAFEMVKVEDAGDGTFFVTTKQTWYGTTETWVYRVAPTEAGMRISELLPPGQ